MTYSRPSPIGRGRASRFIGEVLQEPSASRHGMPHRVAIPDSGNAVLYSQSDSTMWVYPDTDFTSTVRGLSTPTS